ncbi:coiled-coil domain-containing protein 84-like isoform X2 [Pecten maximus]|uniref:coiled-coil domain-containing protein 84-like isoform X2 n=1 Tax=Pecten maximus TaxID=6579 RepID=UPI0014580DED|nr:coiled-coil domain-containing protein 84-like isoform X2 [Pecten maximus]
MEGKREKTSYRQFEYCSFCRFNHKKGKKHLYSKKHRTIIQNILDKTRKKLIEATDTLAAPEVVPLGRTDMSQKFWCYFCVREISRHQMLDICLLKYSSLLEHIASEEHTKKTADFFRAHRINESVCGRDLFCLQPDKLKEFKVLAVHAVRRFEERAKHQIKMIAKKLRNQETTRQMISQSEEWKTVPQQQQISEADKLGHISRYPDNHPNQYVGVAIQSEAGKLGRISGYPNDHLSESAGVSTLSAHGDGVTFIGPQDFLVEEGNVHTGGLPPWLQDNTEDRGQEIGPTLKDYQRHVANEEKKKLPACRVGASFDRSSAKSDTWLPSFGQVWNSGRRLNSKKYYERETKGSTFLGKRARNETVQEANSGDQQGQTQQLGLRTKVAAPYRSKRQRSHDTPTSGHEINNAPLVMGNDGGVGGAVNNSHTNVDQFREGKTTSSAGFHLSSRYGSPDTNHNTNHVESTGVLPYPSQQDYNNMDRGFPPQFRDNRVSDGHNQTVESLHQNKCGQKSNLSYQLEGDINRQLSSKGL